MDRFLGRFSPHLYALLRIVAGFLFAAHGMQKMFGMFGGTVAESFTQAWLGGIIELVGGLMIMIGLQTAWAAFICSGMMAVAYFQFHQPRGALPIQNGGELAALYCWLFLFMASKGSGIWSIDQLISGRRGGRSKRVEAD